MMIHRIWCGPPMPVEYRRFGERWLELNPGCTLQEWTEDAIRDVEWTNQAVIDDLYRRDAGRRSIELFAQLADVVDYELLYRFGGVYVNADIEPIRPLAELEARWPGLYRQSWAVREDEDWLVNAAMGAQPGSAFFGAVIDELAASYFDQPGAGMNKQTGPALLTRVAAARDDLVALPAVTFNPHHWRTIRKGSDASGRMIPDEAIAVHHWGHRRDGRTNRIEKGR